MRKGKKLVLCRETLRRLDATALRGVRGAAVELEPVGFYTCIYASCFDPQCGSWYCPSLFICPSPVPIGTGSPLQCV